MSKNTPKEINPKPKREDFDRVLKNLLKTPPITRDEVHKESKKRKKKLGKVLNK